MTRHFCSVLMIAAGLNYANCLSEPICSEITRLTPSTSATKQPQPTVVDLTQRSWDVINNKNTDNSSLLLRSISDSNQAVRLQGLYFTRADSLGWGNASGSPYYAAAGMLSAVRQLVDGTPTRAWQITIHGRPGKEYLPPVRWQRTVQLNSIEASIVVDQRGLVVVEPTPTALQLSLQTFEGATIWHTTLNQLVRGETSCNTHVEDPATLTVQCETITPLRQRIFHRSTLRLADGDVLRTEVLPPSLQAAVSLPGGTRRQSTAGTSTPANADVNIMRSPSFTLTMQPTTYELRANANGLKILQGALPSLKAIVVVHGDIVDDTWLILWLDNSDETELTRFKIIDIQTGHIVVDHGIGGFI